MAELILIRHGETQWSLSGQHTGLTDIPLTTDGEAQARDLAPVLAGRTFGLVLSSPLRRARHTAELAGLTAIERENRLVEWDYGAYEGLTSPEISEVLGRSWFLWEDGVPAGDTPGETIDQVAARTAAVIARATPTLESGQDVALVAHGHVLRMLGAVWLGLPPSGGGRLLLSPASISTLGYEHDRPVLKTWNTTPRV